MGLASVQGNVRVAHEHEPVVQVAHQDLGGHAERPLRQAPAGGAWPGLRQQQAPRLLCGMDSVNQRVTCTSMCTQRSTQTDSRSRSWGLGPCRVKSRVKGAKDGRERMRATLPAGSPLHKPGSVDEKPWQLARQSFASVKRSLATHTGFQVEGQLEHEAGAAWAPKPMSPGAHISWAMSSKTSCCKLGPTATATDRNCLFCSGSPASLLDCMAAAMAAIT